MTDLQNLRMKLHSRIVYAMRRAAWQASYLPAVKHVKRQYLSRAFSVSSSTALDANQLRAAIDEWTLTIKLSPPTDKHFSIPTDAELKKIVRLGKYKLGSIYGDKWFWNHLPDWTESYYEQVDTQQYPARRVKSLHDLSAYEAEHVIRILEQVEKKVRAAA